MDISDPSFTVVEGAEVILPGYGTLTGQKLLWPVPDLVAPSYADTCRSSGKLQIASVSEFSESSELSSGILVRRGLLSLDDYKCHQDALLPRAIAYSAGLINFFFRGELEIAAPPQRVLAALDQGIPHTVDADGYPGAQITMRSLVSKSCDCVYGILHRTSSKAVAVTLSRKHWAEATGLPVVVSLRLHAITEIPATKLI